MKTLDIFYLVIYWTQKVQNNFKFLCSLHCVLSATLQTINIVVVNLQKKSSSVSNFYRAFKVFIWLSLVRYGDEKTNASDQCMITDYLKIVITLFFYNKRGLVVRVSGYRYRGLGFESRRYQIFWLAVGLERGALSLVSLVRSIEEPLE